MIDRHPANPQPPGPDAGSGEWNGYVLTGDTREERRRRLEQCPVHLRIDVEAHVRDVFLLRRKQRGAHG